MIKPIFKIDLSSSNNESFEKIRLNPLIGLNLSPLGFKISLVYLVVGIADFVYQKHRFNEDMKMTKQELKDEYKNTEGNPEIKGRQRQRMREASQRRMMQDVPKADFKTCINDNIHA